MIRIVCQIGQFLGIIKETGKESGVMTNKTGITILFVFSVLTLVTLAQFSKSAGANNEIAEQTCDVDVWNAMAARARMETEREIMQNQNLIFKADSVLSYVCFDSLAGHAAQNVGGVFSNANRHMTGAMNSVVINSMQTYITSNFNHSLLGGRGQYIGLANQAPPVNGSQTSYGCQVMNEVWQRAKCMNFMHVDEFVQTDGFYPFIDLRGVGGSQPIAGYQSKGNIRRYPTECAGGDPTFVPDGEWLAIYRYSRGEAIDGVLGSQGALYDFQANVNTTFSAVNRLTRPGSAGANGCGQAIPTGVQVMLSPATTAGELYADGVCTNPGCSYVKGNRDAVGECTTAPAVVGNGP